MSPEKMKACKCLNEELKQLILKYNTNDLPFDELISFMIGFCVATATTILGDHPDIQDLITISVNKGHQQGLDFRRENEPE